MREGAGVWFIHIFHGPVDISGTVMGESPDCLLLSGTVVGENPDHVCWGGGNKTSIIMIF